MIHIIDVRTNEVVHKTDHHDKAEDWLIVFLGDRYVEERKYFTLIGKGYS